MVQLLWAICTKQTFPPHFYRNKIDAKGRLATRTSMDTPPASVNLTPLPARLISTWRKTFNIAGWRVGLVLGNAEHINAVLKVKSNMDSGMFYGIQKGAIAALQSGPEWFEALDKVYTKRRELMFQLADKLGCTYDKNAVGMFVWCKLPKGAEPSEEFIDKVLYDKDIFIAPGTIFGSNGEGYIRFSLCVKEDKIKEAIERF